MEDRWLKKNHYFSGIIVTLLLSLSFCSYALTSIVDFTSEIRINQNASLDITETITVDSDGSVIQRGIFRDFPVRYTTSSGIAKLVGLKVISAEINGSPTPFEVSSLGQDERIRIGDPNNYLGPGVYTFKLKYHTTEQIGFFDQHDELYFNVTGTRWQFPIERVKAIVHLPTQNTLDIQQTTAYTGYFGERGADFTTKKSSTDLTFATTRALNMGENLTIVVGWNKGIVIQPDWKQKIYDSFTYYPIMPVCILGLLLVLIYCFIVLWHVNKGRPEKGVIFPRFSAPVGLSPAACRYIMQMGYDDRVLTAALVTLATKGHLKFDDLDEKLTLRKLKSNVPLTQPQKVLMSYLFSNAVTKLVLDQESRTVLEVAIDAYKKELKKEFNQGYYLKNLQYYSVGALLTLVVIASSIFMNDFLQQIFWLIFAGLVLMLFPVLNLRNSIGKRSLPPLIFLLFFIWVFVAVGVPSHLDIQMIVLIIFATMIIVNIIFYYLLRQYTEKGRRLVDQIEGFKMFLEATEKDRLEMMRAPERTPDLFERFLPYAIALGVEKNWSRQFEKLFQEQNYQPSWYVGVSPSKYSNFGSALTQAVSSSVSQAVSPPGSTSGFGGGGGSGGGSSGGGGGGGGGGGW